MEVILVTPNDITTLIGSLGFPIVACAAMFWQNNQLSKQHKEESERWAEALSSNTMAITKLEMTLSKMSERND